MDLESVTEAVRPEEREMDGMTEGQMTQGTATPSGQSRPGIITEAKH